MILKIINNPKSIVNLRMAKNKIVINGIIDNSKVIYQKNIGKKKI